MTDAKKDDFPGVPDLSLEGGSRGRIVTVIVGPERRRYEVQLQRLGRLLWHRLEELSRSIELPEEDHDAFNLFVNWQHNGGRLPRVPDLGSYFPVAGKPPGQAGVQLPFPPRHDLFEPWLLPGINGAQLDRFVHICFYTMYQHYSVEELRLRFGRHQSQAPVPGHSISSATQSPDHAPWSSFTPRVTFSSEIPFSSMFHSRRPASASGLFGTQKPTTDAGSVNTTQATIGNEPDNIPPKIEPEEAHSPTRFSVPQAPFTSGPATKSATPHSEHRNAESRQSDSTVTATESDKSIQNNTAAALSTIPLCIPEYVARKAEALQSTLLNLALMAEEYRLFPLFNAAMDAFRHGELQLQRQHPSLEHVSRCHSRRRPPRDDSVLTRFMHDYAFVRGRDNKVMARYVELFATPGFARAMTDRLDGTIRVPGGTDLLNAGVRTYRY
ncbi:hypothetical protein DL770_000918 [Monosporascus sp. CRB-9-2]|nr:hypothetical protein DL770_000918 [Monosporascus sp. CRB-9-2]